MKSSFQIQATIVANQFIDQYMASANGEYVKVYLYMLRHDGEPLTVSSIADALDHTEADVRRAIVYWEKQGVLEEDRGRGSAALKRLMPDWVRPEHPAANRYAPECAASECITSEYDSSDRRPPEYAASDRGSLEYAASDRGTPKYAASDRRPPESAASDRGTSEFPAPEDDASDCLTPDRTAPDRPNPDRSGTKRSSQAKSGAGEGKQQAPVVSRMDKKKPAARPVYTSEQVNRLVTEEDFTQLLYIAQKYMNKVFTPRDCELFAYLYDGLQMPMELLEYLVEYCVQSGHANLHYMETVALDWHKQGIRTSDAAKTYSAAYTKDTYAVMRAFGLNDRKPAETEAETIRRWFHEYGFSRELVVEACNRTIAAIHTPSFRYADKILTEWKKANVKGMRDIRALDEKREAKASKQPVPPKTGRNQFHNFEQRDTDYDAMVLERVKERLKERMGEQ